MPRFQLEIGILGAAPAGNSWAFKHRRFLSDQTTHHHHPARGRSSVEILLGAAWPSGVQPSPRGPSALCLLSGTFCRTARFPSRLPALKPNKPRSGWPNTWQEGAGERDGIYSTAFRASLRLPRAAAPQGLLSSPPPQKKKHLSCPGLASCLCSRGLSASSGGVEGCRGLAVKRSRLHASPPIKIPPPPGSPRKSPPAGGELWSGGSPKARGGEAPGGNAPWQAPAASLFPCNPRRPLLGWPERRARLGGCSTRLSSICMCSARAPHARTLTRPAPAPCQAAKSPPPSHLQHSPLRVLRNDLAKPRHPPPPNPSAWGWEGEGFSGAPQQQPPTPLARLASPRSGTELTLPGAGLRGGLSWLLPRAQSLPLLGSQLSPSRGQALAGAEGRGGGSSFACQSKLPAWLEEPRSPSLPLPLRKRIWKPGGGGLKLGGGDVQMWLMPPGVAFLQPCVE